MQNNEKENSHFPPEFQTMVPRYFFIALLLFLVILAGALIKPFFTDIFISFILFVISKPLYDLINRLTKGKHVISSLITCIGIIIVIFIPFILFTVILAHHAFIFYKYIEEEFQKGDIQKYLNLSLINNYFSFLKDYNFNFNLVELVGKYLGTLSQFIYANATSIIKGFSSTFINFILVIFITYYMLIDGNKFINEIKKLSPLDDKYDQEIVDELVKTIKITFKGSLVIALIQGFLGAIGFLICGINSWALWGVVMSIASLIPIVGTSIIWVPAVIFLFVTKHFITAIFLTIWGIGVIGVSDNLLRSYILKGETNIHPLLIFFSIIGGISYFGFLGVILGPLVISLLIYILRLYKKFINPKKITN